MLYVFVILGSEKVSSLLNCRNLLFEHKDLVFECFNLLLAYTVAEELWERDCGWSRLPPFKIQCVIDRRKNTAFLVLPLLYGRVVFQLFVVSLWRHISRFSHDAERIDLWCLGHLRRGLVRAVPCRQFDWVDDLFVALFASQTTTDELFNYAVVHLNAIVWQCLNMWIFEQLWIAEIKTCLHKIIS